MQRRNFINAAIVTFGLATVGVAAQQAPQVNTRPAIEVLPLMFKEEWRDPQVFVNGRRRIVLPQSVANTHLELKMYGEQADLMEIILQAGGNNYAAKGEIGGQSLWNGNSRAPVALLLRDKNNFADLTGQARLRAIVRTSGLHMLHPAVKLADGTLIAGHRGIATDGDFLTTEVAFNGMRWYRVDQKTVTTNAPVANPDLSKVDEVGFLDLMPGGGAGLPGGWFNLSTVELYAKPVPR